MKRESHSQTSAGNRHPEESPRPLGALHKDHGWTPEGLQGELEDEGVSVEDVLEKRRLFLAGIASQATPTPGRSTPPFDASMSLAFPLFDAGVAAGAPAWSESAGSTRRVCAQDLLGPCKDDDCLWARVSGDSMKNAGILDGSYVLVNRSVEPRDGDVVLAYVAGQGQVVKRLRLRGGGAFLESDNPDFADIAIDDPSTLKIHGVVKGAVLRFPERRSPARS